MTNLSANQFKDGIVENDKILTTANNLLIGIDDFRCFPRQNYDDSLDMKVTKFEVMKALSSMKNSKSSGPDFVVYEIFKKNTKDTVDILTSLFNKVFVGNSIPWNESWISPIFKKGDKNEITSYRHINLSSCLEKLMTKILNAGLNVWIEKYDLVTAPISKWI